MLLQGRLLLQGDLQDKVIPHQTKICEAIVTAWKTWFTSLKCNFTVSLTLEYHGVDHIFRKLPDESALLLTFGLTITTAGTWLSHVTGLHEIRLPDVSNSGELYSHFITSMVAMMARPWQMLPCICWIVLASQPRYVYCSITV
jgi:hypothetical protein